MYTLNEIQEDIQLQLEWHAGYWEEMLDHNLNEYNNIDQVNFYDWHKYLSEDVTEYFKSILAAYPIENSKTNEIDEEIHITQDMLDEIFNGGNKWAEYENTEDLVDYKIGEKIRKIKIAIEKIPINTMSFKDVIDNYRWIFNETAWISDNVFKDDNDNNLDDTTEENILNVSDTVRWTMKH